MENLREQAALAAFQTLLQHEKEKERADKTYNVIEYGLIAHDAWLAADAFINERPTDKEIPLRLSPETRKFLLEIIEENSPEKAYEEMYRKMGEPLPEWLAEKIAEANKKKN
jgi:hypothetical protein